jgi:hypothetical protein
MNEDAAARFYAYYQAQALGRGVGGGVKFNRTQRGNGIGSYFSGLFRRIMPYVKSSLSTVGSELANTGVNILRDYISGKDPKSSINERISTASSSLGSKASAKLSNMLGLGYKRRRKTPAAQSSLCKRSTKVVKRKRDIFGF